MKFLTRLFCAGAIVYSLALVVMGDDSPFYKPPAPLTGYLYLTHSHFVANGTTTTINTSSTTYLFGQTVFSNAKSSETNCAAYVSTVPDDLSATVEMKVARFKFTLGNTDTGTHRYVIAYRQTASSANPSAPGSGTLPINMDFSGDAQGASGDIETVSDVTLTGWAAALTPGALFQIEVCRDGNATQDASTVNSTSGPLVISYRRAQ